MNLCLNAMEGSVGHNQMFPEHLREEFKRRKGAKRPFGFIFEEQQTSFVPLSSLLNLLLWQLNV